MKLNKNNRKKIIFGSTLTIILLTLFVIILSFILSKLGIGGEKTQIVTGNLETSIVTVNNILSWNGFRFIIGNAITNFELFHPLVLMIISIISVGILDSSGLLEKLISPLKKVNGKTITLFVVFISILFSFFGEYSYVLLLPLIGPVYKKIDRNPVLGIITVFLAITLGSGAGFIYNYNDYVLGTLTELSASVGVDVNYKFKLLSTNLISSFSVIIMTLAITFIIEKFIILKLPKYKKEEIEELEIIEDEEVMSSSFKKTGLPVVLSLIVMFYLVLYSVLPNLPFSGILLNQNEPNYIAKLFSNASPFKEGFIIIILIISMVSSYLYGKTTGKIKNNCDYNLKLGFGFENIGQLFVLMFFISQLIAVLNWTNIGEVLASIMISFISSIQFSGILLIIIFFITVIIMTILIPSSLTKWNLMSPLIVPLFMRSNMTPDYAQFIFKVADGIGRGLTPLFIYFIIMIAFIKKYQDDKCSVTIFGLLKLLFKPILFITAVWITIIVLWYVIGLPIGIGTYPII